MKLGELLTQLQPFIMEWINNPHSINIGNNSGAEIGTALADGYEFPATQVPSADTHTLDDYEEGQVTVTLTATSGTITLTTGKDKLNYTKIGRQVTLTGYIQVASISSPAGQLVLGGLPFTCITGYAGYSASSIYATGLMATAITTLMGATIPNTTTIYLFNYAAGAIANVAGDVQANTEFAFCVTYFA